MKRVLAILLTVSCLLLAGCSQVWEDLGNISSDIGQMGKPTEPPSAPPAEAPTQPPHAETIPWILMQREEDLFQEEYAPTLRFHQNGSCDMKLNMAEFMLEITGHYEVKAFEDGSRVIRCTYDTETSSGVERHQNLFFLLEEEPGVWTFYGEGVGLTWTGGRFYPAGAETVTVDTPLLPVSVPETAQYTDVMNSGNTLFFTKDAGPVLSFDVKWHRLDDMTGVTGHKYGSYAFFTYSVMEEEVQKDWTAGYLEFTDSQTVNLTIFDSQLTGITPGTYTYQLVQQPEIS